MLVATYQHQVNLAGDERIVGHRGSGATQTQCTYEPFGQTTVTGPTGGTFQYTGRENDGTGLYYYRARYYHPTLGRFISEDPIEFGGGQTNLYSYVGNDPLGYVDPGGMQAMAIPWGAGGFGTFVGASQFVPGWDVAVDTALLGGAAILATAALAKSLENDSPDESADAQGGTLSGRKPPEKPDDKCKERDRWPDNPEDMDKLLGFKGTRVPDGLDFPRPQ